MSFWVYDLIFLVVFSLFVIIFLYKRKKNLQREGILYLYRTKVGLKIIDYVGRKYKRTLMILNYLSILTGYILMFSMIYLLGKMVYIFLTVPDFIRAVKIPPLMPLIPYFPSLFKVDFLPPFYFAYWIIAIAIIAVSHEFSHGIFARFHNIKVRSTGFGFLGPFLAAFVEPDEKQMNKAKIGKQLGILTAGSFANVIMTILFILIFWLFFIVAFVPAGVMINSYASSLVPVEDINSIGNESIIINFNGELNLTEIYTTNGKYYLMSSLVNEINKYELVEAFDDAPAIKAGVVGVIIEIDGKMIKQDKDLKQVLSEKKPGDIVKIKTQLDGEESINEYEIELGKRPDNPELPFLGISPIKTTGGMLREIRDSLIFFKDPYTYYKPRISEDLILFIYNLLWWIIIINLSVALVNMLPVGMFDGGRVFYLTCLAIFKKEKIAKIFFRLATYLILLAFLLLMFSWFLAIF